MQICFLTVRDPRWNIKHCILKYFSQRRCAATGGDGEVAPLQTCTSIGALSSILHLSRSMDADLHLDRESSEMKHKAPNLEGQERRSTSQNFALSKVLYLPSCNPNDQGMQIYFLTMRASRWNIKHPIFKYFSQRCCGVWRR
jgi:hypothetical protein